MIWCKRWLCINTIPNESYLWDRRRAYAKQEANVFPQSVLPDSNSELMFWRLLSGHIIEDFQNVLLLLDKE